MKRSRLPFDDVETIAAEDAGNGPAMPAHGGADDTLFHDEGEPFPLALDASSVVTVVTAAPKCLNRSGSELIDSDIYL